MGRGSSKASRSSGSNIPDESALYIYESSLGWEINKVARGQKSGGNDPLEAYDPDNEKTFKTSYNSLIGKLDTITNKKLSKDTKMYRGVNSDAVKALTGYTLEQIMQNTKVVEGKSISDKGFTSTSYDKSMALRYAGRKGALINIKAKKGSKALFDDSAGASKNWEFVLPRNAKMKIKKARVQDGRLVIDMEY